MGIEQVLKNNYELVATIKEGGATVRVWKPRSIGELPDGLKEKYARSLIYDARSGGHGRGYWKANPDYGSWDALVLKKYSNEKLHALRPKNELDIYVCAVLVRPFSRLAMATYHTMILEDLGKPHVHRAMMMWDSRLFDKNRTKD